MKYKRHVATSVLALSLITGGVSAFAADMTASTTKMNQYSNQVKMRSTLKQDKLDSSDLSLSTKKANHTKNKTKKKSNSVDSTVDPKDAFGKDIESNDDSVKKASTGTKKVHKKIVEKPQMIKNPIGSI